MKFKTETLTKVMDKIYFQGIIVEYKHIKLSFCQKTFFIKTNIEIFSHNFAVLYIICKFDFTFLSFLFKLEIFWSEKRLKLKMLKWNSKLISLLTHIKKIIFFLFHLS